MFETDQYELIDFGRGRKLERFGSLVLDRPSPAAEGVTPAAKRWQADWRYVRRGSGQGRWTAAAGRRARPEEWTIRHDSMHLGLRMNEFGHLGIFPEQAANWDWLTKRISRSKEAPRVLNLFAYTGGSTLAAAAAGAEVVHVDAAENVVRWARENAELSGLAGAPIRWIVEDAVKFVEREVRRGNRYDAVILDPPSYGHGPKGQVWKLSHDLPRLLAACAELVNSQLKLLLFTCHTPGHGPAELQAYLEDAFFGHCQTGAGAKTLFLATSDGRRLPSGVVARWPA